MTTAAHTGATIIPTMRYRNAPEAIDWLCRAFGFETHAVYPNETGGIAHAQLTLGNGMIMVGTASDEGIGRRMVLPGEIGGRQTQCPCVIVSDPDAHCARAKAAGAEIVYGVADQDYGGRAYACLDVEGYLWWFGSYDPWETTS